jgi:hypothetical protein
MSRSRAASARGTAVGVAAAVRVGVGDFVTTGKPASTAGAVRVETTEMTIAPNVRAMMAAMRIFRGGTSPCPVPRR